MLTIVRTWTCDVEGCEATETKESGGLHPGWQIDTREAPLGWSLVCGNLICGRHRIVALTAKEDREFVLIAADPEVK